MVAAVALGPRVGVAMVVPRTDLAGVGMADLMDEMAVAAALGIREDMGDGMSF